MRGKMRPLKPFTASATALDTELTQRTARVEVKVTFESETGRRYSATRTVKVRLRKERLRQTPLFPEGDDELRPPNGDTDGRQESA